MVPYIDMTHEQLAAKKPEYQIKVPYKNCEFEDFLQYGYKNDTKSQRLITDRIKFRLCPNIHDPNYKRLFMKYDQPNTVERAYTAMKIRRCNSTIDKIECASEAKISKLLDNLVFTFYFITGVAELGKKENYNKNPI